MAKKKPPIALDPIVDRVADLLAACPLTDYAIAKRSGVRPDTVKRIRLRQNGVRSSILSQILRGLGYEFELKKVDTCD